MNAPPDYDRALDKISIYDLWRFFQIPGSPSKSCRSPFREDHNPSFSVYDHGRRWKDFATGESGNSVGFIARLLQISISEACQKLREIAGLLYAPKVRFPRNKNSQKTKPAFPNFEKGTKQDYEKLSNLRNVSIEALQMASARGLLWFANSKEGKQWLITDSMRWSAITRRLDGKPWEGLDGNPKSKTLFGSVSSWPIGIPEAANYPSIALTEGMPDFLSVFHHALSETNNSQVAPVCMAGATISIHEECLPLFKGKHVRVFIHNDKAGKAGFENWARQLLGIAAKVDGFEFSNLTQINGQPVKDLNDLCRIDADSWEENKDSIDGCMTF